MNYIKFTRRNIRRSPFQAIAASMVMFFTFFVMLMFFILAAGSEQILKFYEGKPQVIAFFKDGTVSEDVKAIQNALTNEGRVTDTKYVSKEDALKIYQNFSKDEPLMLELVTASILPASLEISTKTPEDLSPIAEILKREPVVDDVIFPKDVVEQLTNATRTIRWVGGATVIFLTLFSTLIILMVTGFKIRLKRQEIEIMRLMGASNSFIRAPFILEGIFYGVVGAILAWIFTLITLWYFSPWIQTFLGQDLRLLPINPLFMLALLGIELIIAIIVGGLGSIGAVRRYLKI